MKPFEFAVSVEVDKHTGAVLAAYFQVRRGRSAETREFAGGKAFADYSDKGQLLGIELLEPCRIHVLDEIAVDPPVKKFIRTTIPKKMVLA
jgi:uncharacterized protein YuzE